MKSILRQALLGLLRVAMTYSAARAQAGLGLELVSVSQWP